MERALGYISNSYLLWIIKVLRFLKQILFALPGQFISYIKNSTPIYPQSMMSAEDVGEKKGQQDYEKLQQSLVSLFKPTLTSGYELASLIRWKSCKATGNALKNNDFRVLIEVIDESNNKTKRMFLETAIPVMEDGVLMTKKTNMLGRFSSCKDALVLSRQEIFNLLSCCFFCCFPESGDNNKAELLNFSQLFEKNYLSRGEAQKEKIKCLMAYFCMAAKFYCNEVMAEIVSLKRNVVLRAPDWSSSEKQIIPLEVTYSDTAMMASMCKVDFANKRIGGGVLGSGTLQEEIMFITCPELIIARFFSSKMEENEAIVITGVRQYSNYDGYAEDFKFKGVISLDSSSDFPMQIVAMDALDFTHKPPYHQYSKECVHRELLKAYTAFSAIGSEEIASGNWGGGCFKGDPVLKAKIQMIAASEAGKKVHFNSFKNQEVQNDVSRLVYNVRKDTVADEYHSLVEYYLAKARSALESSMSSYKGPDKGPDRKYYKKHSLDSNSHTSGSYNW